MLEIRTAPIMETITTETKTETRMIRGHNHWLSMSRTKSQAGRDATAIGTWRLVWFRSLKLLPPRFTEIVRKLHAVDMLSIHGNSACESISD